MPASAERRHRAAILGGCAAAILALYLTAYGAMYARRTAWYENGMGLWYWRYPRCDDLCWSVFWPAYQAHRRLLGGRRHHRDQPPDHWDP